MGYKCGSTCLIVIEYKENNELMLQIINVGDCRSIICNDTMSIQLTKDHKPQYPDERKRIEKLGGKIIEDSCYNEWRIGPYSVSRAFGDFDLEKYITYEPEIFKYKIKQEDKFMIMACDGLWDLLNNQDIINYILMKYYDKDGNRININKNIAKELAKIAIKEGSGDNISIIIRFFD